MRGMLAALCLLAAVGFVSGQAATAAVPATSAIKDAVTARSPVQMVQYRERHTRHGIVKCYRDFVVGPYRCHYYRNW